MLDPPGLFLLALLITIEVQKHDIHLLASALKKDVWNPELTLIIVKKETMQFKLSQGYCLIFNISFSSAS